MKFLIDANMPRGLAEAIRALGHDAVDIRDIQLGDAADGVIDALALAERRCLLTLDWDFADVRNYPPRERAGLVIFEPVPNATWRQVVAMVQQFVGNPELIEAAAGALVIVEPDRVRIRRGEA